MRKRIVLLSAVLASLLGCYSESPTPGKPASSAAQSLSSPATSQPSAIIAEMSELKITEPQFDHFVYEAYGLRLLFDMVELELAKDMLARRGLTLTPADIQKERQIILAKICGDAPQSSYDNLFQQFLQQEHLSKAEFDLKIVQTNACLRKIVEPVILGKFTDDTVHKGFEQLYGAKRQIADIELTNMRDARIAQDRLKTQPFEKVAVAMSVDRRTADQGGVWPPFSAQNTLIPKVILDEAFRLDKGQVSDPLSTSTSYHIIKVMNVVEPTVVKFEDVKDQVRKQMEDQAIEVTSKNVREQLNAMAQHQLIIHDPTLKAQWDALVASQQSQTADRNGVLQQMNDAHARTTTQPSTMP